MIRKTSTLRTRKLNTPAIKTCQADINSEHELQKACVAKLRAHQMICSCTDVFNAISFMKDIRSKSIYKTHMTRMGGSVGFPDLIILFNNVVTFVEFKWKKGKKSPEQETWTKILNQAGYTVLEWRTLEECEAWIVKTLGLNGEKCQSGE